MNRTASPTSFLVVQLLLAIVWASAADGAEEVSFNRDVRPILSDRCFHCHGPDAKNQDSEFRLNTREFATADLGGYAGVVPGDLAASELHQRIRSTGDDQMPPLDSHRVLSAAEKDILDAWILNGAPFDSHWSFTPLPKAVTVPDAGKDWAQNKLDHFIAKQHTEFGLTPNIEATREKWLRRVSFDLTGLPPTLEELDHFLNDSTTAAHQRVVERLLDSDACAERLTSEWLDVARYADSYGYQRDDERYVWPWRDWVIHSFRRNMPFDEFLTWQLAGDLMPNATREQRLATAFHRLHSHKKEGGSDVEEFRVEYVADRTHTVATAFMGLTFECARCHDHKYDPITTKEYYQLGSFFANIEERGLISFFTGAVPTPAMPLPSADQEKELAAATEVVRSAERKLTEAGETLDSEFQTWLEQRDASEPLPGLVASLSFDKLEPISGEKYQDEDGGKHPPEQGRELLNEVPKAPRARTSDRNVLVPGKHGNALRLTGDDPVVLPELGQYERHQPFSVSLWINSPEITERDVIFRHSCGWDDAGSMGYSLVKEKDRLVAQLAHFWPGNVICVKTRQPLTTNRWYHVTVTYDGSSRASGLNIYVDGALAETTVVKDHLTRKISNWGDRHSNFAIGTRFRDRGFKDGLVDEFRLFGRCLSPLEARQLFDESSLEEMLRVPSKDLSDQQREELKTYYTSAVHQPTLKAVAKLEQARQQRNVVLDATPAIMVMREQTSPRPAYVLTRGAYDQRGEQVTADTPAFLPAFPRDAPRNRLGLARWLTSHDHPLTARVTVNRYWQMLFGEGLVRTPEDFGFQGEPPTHSELLDWLARDFVDHGWDVRRLLRTLVLSATYRQSAMVSPDQRQRDPENLHWARGPSQRLSAEMIRDNALTVSGLLVRNVGGPPVKPYDLALAYTPLKVDKGDGLHRRSLYTFWKRTAPAPVMMTMNASKREVCRVRREVTASPLQALVLLNGAQFVEASQACATRLLVKHGEDIESLAAEAFRLLTSRMPTEREAEILQTLYEEQLREFRANPQRVESLLSSRADAKHKAELSPELAAATVLVNSLMNLDESVRHQ